MEGDRNEYEIKSDSERENESISDNDSDSDDNLSNAIETETKWIENMTKEVKRR